MDQLFFKDQTVDIHHTGVSPDRLHRTRVVDLDKDYLAVRAYDQHGELIDLSIGTEVELYFVRPDAIYSMLTHVTDKAIRPEPVLILERDDEKIKRLQRRRFFRVSVRVKVKFLLPDDEVSEEDNRREELTYTYNLSAGGLFCPIQSTCQVGDPLELHLFLPKEDEPIHAIGKVVRVQEKKNNLRNIGVNFENIRERDRARLTRFLFRAQARSLS